MDFDGDGSSIDLPPLCATCKRNRPVVLHIGAVRLQALRPLDLTRYYSTLLESGRQDSGGLSVKTVRNIHRVLRKAFNDAVPLCR